MILVDACRIRNLEMLKAQRSSAAVSKLALLSHKDTGRESRQSTSRGSRVPTPMNEKDQYKNRIELLQGTLDMLILQTLQWGPQHGYGIVQALRLRSGDVLQVETGSLYPALHRLERQGWVQSEWKQSESKQRARYYRITAKGKKQLASDLGRWERIVEAIGSVMYVKPKESES